MCIRERADARTGHPPEQGTRLACVLHSVRESRDARVDWRGGRRTATELIDVHGERPVNRELGALAGAGPEGGSLGALLRTVLYVLATAVSYYGATQIAWALTFPDSKVSLFFPPHPLLISILLFVPTRQWWAFTLAAASAHFVATQQAQWPTIYALNCEVFDAIQNVGTAAGIRMLIRSPIKTITLRDAVLFVLIAVVVVPFGSAFWGASFTVAYGFGTSYWIEWRNLGISNAVTSVVLIPAFPGCSPSVRQTPESPVPATRAGSGSRRCVYGGAGNPGVR